MAPIYQFPPEAHRDDPSKGGVERNPGLLLAGPVKIIFAANELSDRDVTSIVFFTSPRPLIAYAMRFDARLHPNRHFLQHHLCDNPLLLHHEWRSLSAVACRAGLPGLRYTKIVRRRLRHMSFSASVLTWREE